MSLSKFMNKVDRFLDGGDVRRQSAYREWDRLRSEAVSPSERAEIDAIFGRQVDSL